MLDPGLLATLSLTSAHVLTDSPDLVDLYYKSKSVILLVGSLYAEATEAVKLQAALSASSAKIIWILN
jgi:hypothetical protein